MTSIASTDLAAVMGGCRQGQQPQQPDPSQGDPQQQQQAAPQQQQGGGFDWRSLLGQLLGMAQQFLQPQQQQQQ